MKRAVVLVLVLVSVILGVVGSVSAAHDEIKPFTLQSTRMRP